MRAERIGAETLLAQIVHMVAEAQRTRAPIQKLADVVSAIFVPAVVGTAVVAFFVWSIYGPPPAMAFALVSAVSVLISACPCAPRLATPLSIMVGTGRGAQAGVLICRAASIASVPRALTDRAHALRRRGETVVFLSDGARAARILGVADPIKASTPEALRALAAEGVRVVMLTGDNELTARAVAGRLGIEEVRAD